MDWGQIIGTGVGIGASVLSGGAIPPTVSIPAGQALGETIEGGIKSNQAKKMQPPLNDPEERASLDKLKNQQDLMESGQYFAAPKADIMQRGQEAINAVSRVTGGDIGATITGINRVNRGTGRNLNELYGQMSIEGLKLQQVIGGLQSSMAKRRLGIQMYQEREKALQGQEEQKKGGENLNALLASGTKLSDLLAGLNKSTPTGGGDTGGSGVTGAIGGSSFGQPVSGGFQDVGMNSIVNNFSLPSAMNIF
jgi:hypothetical protein